MEKKLIAIVVEFAKYTCDNSWNTYFSEICALQNTSMIVCLELLESTIIDFTNFDSSRYKALSLIISQNLEIITELVYSCLKHFFPMLKKGTSPISTYRGSPASHISYSESQSPRLFNSSQQYSPNTPFSALNSQLSVSEIVLTLHKALDILQRLFELNCFYETAFIQDALKIIFDYAAITDDFDEMGNKALSVIEEFMSHTYLPDSHLNVAIIATDRLLELISLSNEMLKIRSENLNEE